MSGKISGAMNNPPPATAAGSVGQRAAATASAAPNGATATATASATANATANAAAAANAVAAASTDESVQITDTASHLITAEQALNNLPVINPGRVSQARESLASGTYRISPERIGNQLLQFERLLPAEDPTE
ncbi:MAG TPA: flagellar biosynthesis anti-sigma factor FlgM [Steroidobacteraceae bacterium]|nr:flagellar biosynthesis anti-sigma factor FlgM [Steroidobacteraceae bacterium]